jgi:hypothetical protein
MKDEMNKVQPTEVVSYPTQHAAPAKVEVAAQPAPKEYVAPVAAAPAAPVDLSSAGLTMIETDPNKAASIAPVVVENQPQAPRRRQRQREVYTIENSEPLQQVETQSPN